jgi:hypothetical protein
MIRPTSRDNKNELISRAVGSPVAADRMLDLGIARYLIRRR